MVAQDEKRGSTRKHPRARLVTQVEATTVGRTENISEGGILLLTKETFQPDTEVVVRFTLPPNHFVSTPGRVAHIQPGVCMGIEFTDLKEADKKAIADYVRESAEE